MYSTYHILLFVGSLCLDTMYYMLFSIYSSIYHAPWFVGSFYVCLCGLWGPCCVRGLRAARAQQECVEGLAAAKVPKGHGSYMGSSQDHGPFLGPEYNAAPSIQGIQEATVILTTTHIRTRRSGILRPTLTWPNLPVKNETDGSQAAGSSSLAPGRRR